MPTKKPDKKAKPKELKVYKLEFREEHLYAIYIAAPSRRAAEDWADDQSDISGIVLDIVDCKGTAKSFECEKVTVCKDLKAHEADFIVDEKGKEIEDEDEEDEYP